MPSDRGAPAVTPDVLRDLAPRGALRTAINLGNPVLAQRDPASGALRGTSVDLAQELGRRLAVPVELVPFDAAGKVFAAIPTDVWDVAFLARDPARATQILFTAPYVIIEGTYLVPAASSFRAVEELDRAGVRIAVGRGAAYDLYLTRSLRAAQLVRAETSPAALELFLEQRLEAAAGVRNPLVEFARTHPGLRVLDGRFTAIEQAVGTPRGREAGAAWLEAFVEDVKSSGFVAASLKKSGQRDAAVAPPAR